MDRQDRGTWSVFTQPPRSACPPNVLKNVLALGRKANAARWSRTRVASGTGYRLRRGLDSIGVNSLLVSHGERRSRTALRAVEDKWGVRIHPKTSVADALVLRGKQHLMASNEYRFALMAHFDFLLTDEEDERPLLAIEYDPAQHDTDPPTIKRDRMKDSLARRFGLPLLRVKPDSLRDVVPGTTLVRLVVEEWLQSHRWTTWGEGEPMPPDSVADEARQEISEAFSNHDCCLPGPVLIRRPIHWRGFEDDVSEEYAVMPLVDGSTVVIGHGTCDGVALGRGVGVTAVPSSIAWHIAELDLAERLRRAKSGQERAQPLDALTQLNVDTAGWRRYFASPWDYEEAELDAGDAVYSAWSQYASVQAYIDPEGRPWEQWLREYDPEWFAEEDWLREHGRGLPPVATSSLPQMP